MSINQDDYARTDAEFERILAESLNDCILPKQDIKDILLEKSVHLYLENLLKNIIIHVSTYKQETKCISCYTESVNVLNICKCGLENLCYSCFLSKYVSMLTDTIKTNKSIAIQNNIFNKNEIIKLLTTTISCKYCKTHGCFQNALYKIKTPQNKVHIFNETDFLMMETKTLIDIFPKMNMSNFIKKKNMEVLTNYGFELEYDELEDGPIIKINLKHELIESLLHEFKYIRTPINIDFIKCDCKIITPAVFNAIYYKCIDFGLKNKNINRDLLFRWNKHCQKLNTLLDTYSKNIKEGMNYYVISVLINEINTIE